MNFHFGGTVAHSFLTLWSEVVVEIDGSDKPALVAEWFARHGRHNHTVPNFKRFHLEGFEQWISRHDASLQRVGAFAALGRQLSAPGK